MSARIAIIPGTFDPWTLGHDDVLRAAAKLFDKVVVAFMTNSEKSTTMFTIGQRMEMLRAQLATDPNAFANVTIAHYPDYPAYLAAADEGAAWLVRGLRLTTEYEKELVACFVNAGLLIGLQTIYIPPVQEHIQISSSVVRELIRLKHVEKIYHLVPHEVYRRIIEQLTMQED